MLTDAAPDISYRYRFAEFEFWGRTGELWRCGQDLHLPDQAGRVLLALLRADGQLVSRDDLKKALWPDRSYGDLEGGLNAAVRKLRQLLEDDGAEPHVIGTLPKHGYRLLVPVTVLEDPTSVAPARFPSSRQEPPPESGSGRPPSAGQRRIWLAALAVLLLTGSLWYLTPGAAGVAAGRTPGAGMRDGVSGIDFVWIPAGTFTMGSPASEEGHKFDEGPPWRVTIAQGFWLGKFEVTQGQYAAVMGTNPSEFKEVGTSAPVENVSWDDAQAFLQKLNQRGAGRSYRLPTEAEWEYACRAGTTGSCYGPLNNIAWYWKNAGDATNPVNQKRPKAWSSNTTHPVGQKQPNAWGLYDMLGNVWEWCQDWYLEQYDTTQNIDPVGPATGQWRVVRGGSWTKDRMHCRAAYRSGEFTPETRVPIAGFRVVCVPVAGRP